MRKIVTERLNNVQCTGCGACMNICPVNAIGMQPDRDSFIMPTIDTDICITCGKCVDICPVLNPVFTNVTNPECYAFRASDKIRKDSSSGGAFPLLADYILRQNGYICGAIFDDNFNVVHIVSNTSADIEKMRGSKYVQSDVNLIYRTIGELLDKGEKVLFTGTPCQVAALNAFLGKSYAGLYCVDLLCHGVPSQKIFHMHLNEISKGKQIKHISFRDKKYGWRPDATTLHIEFTDSSIYSGKSNVDQYQKGFLSNLILRSACINCIFCDYPRQGDMSIGDFWWYDSIPGGDKEKLGTSLLLINSEKGRELLAAFRGEGNFLKKHDVNPSKLPNRVKAAQYQNDLRSRFFDLLQDRSFADAFYKAQSKFYDVGIVGPYGNKNIGGFLTYFALYHTINDMGYAPLMIGSPLNAPWGGKADLGDFLEEQVYPDYAMVQPLPTKYAMRGLNNKCGQFVVGSDQVFNPPLFNGWGKYTQLDWVSDNKKKIAYASSFGFDHLDCAEAERAEMAYFLQKFDAFSVREAGGVALCANALGVNAQHVLDPVFLCADVHYAKLAEKAPQDSSSAPFLYAYILYSSNDKQKLVDGISKYKGIPYRLYTEFGKDNKFYLKVREGKLNERVRDMRQCSFTVTDSFHGVCFSIIFRKDFVVLPNFNWAFPRYVSILGSLGLMNRMVKNWEEFEERREELLETIDYDAVYKRLDPLIDYSRVWLRTQLATEKAKSYSDYDIARKLCAEMEGRLNKKLKEQEERFAKEIETLKESHKNEMNLILRNHGGELSDISSFQEYLARLNALKKNIVIFIAVNDTPAGRLNDQIMEELGKLGIKENLNEHFRKAYIAVISEGKATKEQIGKDGETLVFDESICSKPVSLHSAPYGSQPMASIKIDGREWAINKRGLNFVIMDQAGGHVIDSVAFDTFLGDIPATRQK